MAVAHSIAPSSIPARLAGSVSVATEPHVWQHLDLDANWVPLAPGRSSVLRVRSGSLLLRSREMSLRLEPGVAVIADGREPLWIRALAWDPAEAFELRLSSDWLAEVQRRAAPTVLRGAGLLPLMHASDSAFAAACAELDRSCAMPDATTARVERALAHLLVLQNDCAPEVARCHGRTSARRRDLYIRLSRARALLLWSNDPVEDLASLAQVARLSQAHFVRLFHEVFGQPPLRFGREERLQRAHRLIAESNTPIQDVLADVGFESHSSFARAFRQRFGVSASELRAARVPSTPGVVALAG